MSNAGEAKPGKGRRGRSQATEVGRHSTDAASSAGAATPACDEDATAGSPGGASSEWLAKVRWNDDGLAPAIAQDAATGKVLTLAWMNREALARTQRTGEVHYWSRSRGRLWHKGESSGHVQKVREIRLDCDADAILLVVESVGGVACHTGRERCFYRRLENGQWRDVEPVIEDPEVTYGGR